MAKVKLTQTDRLFNLLLKNRKGVTAAEATRRGVNQIGRAHV
jgi:hypothetical protein